MNTKPWYESKVIWLGVLTVIAGIVPLAVQLAAALSPDNTTVATAIGAFLIGVLNIILRVGTNKTIA